MTEAALQQVFVLSTGRCGSTTFTRACDHLTNYTAGHETRSRRLGDARFAYPARHIESDNRLSWHLGSLGARFDDAQVLYVHLHRDREAVAQSFLKRWDSTFRPSMISAFGHGIVQRSKDWPESRRISVCRFYVDTVTANIQEFLRNRAHLRVDTDQPQRDFHPFLDRIGAEGDLDAAMGEWQVRHNSSPTAAPIERP